MTRRWLLGVLMVLWAAAPAVPAAPDPDEARALVERTTRQVLDAVRARRAELEKDPARVYDIIERFVLPHFDFQRMSQHVLGVHWRRATPEQRRRFVRAFERLLVRTYGSAVGKYRDERIVFAPVKARPGADDVVVHAEVEQPGGFPIGLDYRLYYGAEGWKVYDIVVDGLSLLTNYRTSFRDEIRRAGLEALIVRLEEQASSGG
ncbi:MlaC/ttg2D family ABC transporter substrate-binding protein [Inmirania thermothiophila]|uniref:Phospholipid transport system substrate-binding protein n=1 Tax=Inmirania thermothiophila TaxID=1750597 RepID=A0A3N1XT09_9GAMM|nr:ABC transporter substrate-binding protein [Inmirania thermothiophila]ROR29769.1 phospholipid transport system substrate-binding protein [Inmirania thermothiophila]